jgi:copper(I)-binding protein
MKRVVALVVLVAVALSVGRAGLAHPAAATPPTIGSPMASPVAAAIGAAFLTVINHGRHDDELVAAASSISANVEIHETENHAGVMEMRPVDDVEIHAGETVIFKPGGYHFMLVGLKQDLTPGSTFTLTLTFEHAGKVTVPVMVRGLDGSIPAGATPPAAVKAGAIEVDQAWARPAPALTVAPSMTGTPVVHGSDDGHHDDGHDADGTAESH